MAKPFNNYPPEPPRIEIMRLYARMTDQQRRALLEAAIVISKTADVWQDTMPEGAMETDVANFDPEN